MDSCHCTQAGREKASLISDFKCYIHFWGDYTEWVFPSILEKLWLIILVLVTSWIQLPRMQYHFWYFTRFPFCFVLFLKIVEEVVGTVNLEMSAGEVDSPVKTELNKRCSHLIPLLVKMTLASHSSYGAGTPPSTSLHLCESTKSRHQVRTACLHTACSKGKEIHYPPLLRG